MEGVEKDEENTMVDKAIGIYVNDMIKHTLKVYTLSLALSERDPSSAFETIQESLEKVFLNTTKSHVDRIEQHIQSLLGETGSHLEIVFNED